MTETASPIAGKAPLSVAADLTVQVNGATADVRSTGERLFIEFESLVGAIQAVRGLPDDGAGALTPLLETTDLTVEVRIRDRTVAVAGVNARPGVVAQTLDIDPIEVRIGGVIAAVGQELGAGVQTLRRLLD
ncbi:MAG: hypothetical protein SVG88_07305 [Halobacteriales archaeon]|nr:hypothetical protein [Halobacteriales archaeon]